MTLFHGLPSDRVRAIAQDGEGVMWFGTDSGLARYDGRRTQTVAVEGLAAQSRVLALRFDAESGALWAGTDDGAAVLFGGAWRAVAETKGKAVTSILTAGRGRAWLATAAGQLFECNVANSDAGADAGVASAGSSHVVELKARAFPSEALRSADVDDPGALQLTSLARAADGTLYAGSRSRGVFALRGERMEEIASRPRAYFVEALESDADGEIWIGARGGGAGLYAAGASSHPRRVAEVQAAVHAVSRDTARGGVWVGTAGQGAMRFAGERVAERFTFEATAGGLRSNTVYSVFTDAEGVVWFGTDRGVCRFDAQAPRNEAVSPDIESNFVRALYRSRAGRLLCGTNRGLFVFDERANAWQRVGGIGDRAVYALAEDARGRLLVGTSAGLYTGTLGGALELFGVAGEGRGDRPAAADDRDAAPRQAQATRPRADGRGAEQPGAGETVAGESSAAGRGAEQARAVERERVASRSREREAAEARARANAARERAGESVRAIRNFRGATYVAVYGRGVERVEGERRTLVWPRAEADAAAREVTTLHADGDARLWAGTARAGAYAFADDARGFTPERIFERAGGQQPGAIWSVDGDDSRGHWFATSAGLFYRGAGAETTKVVADVEARAVVAAGDARSPEAWAATAGGGLLRVKIDEEFGPLVSRLDAEQGLASSQAFALLRVADAGGGAREGNAAAESATPAVAAAARASSENSANGAGGSRVAAETLIVGTSRGVVRYSPGASAPTLVPVRVMSRGLHQTEELREGIRLPYPQNSLALDVAALSSRTFPEQFRYAFVLRDAKGREIRRRLSADGQFVMENLPPDGYAVEARAFTKDLTASAPLRFNFTVGRAPFPRTTVALGVLLALALVALLWGAWQYGKVARATAALAEANHELAGARLNLANEAERERRRIARDLHDQTLADLRSLMLLTDQLPADANPNGGKPNGVAPAAFRSEIESISVEIRRICEDLSPSALDNVGLAAALEWALTNSAAHCPEPERFDYEFSADEDFDERLSVAPGVRMQIYRIAQEAITNVCRHARARRVLVAAGITAAGELLLVVEDDGRAPFDPADRKARRGRGLASIRDRASLIEADVNWERLPAGGTRFTLRKAGAARPEAAKEAAQA